MVPEDLSDKPGTSRIVLYSSWYPLIAFTETPNMNGGPGDDDIRILLDKMSSTQLDKHIMWWSAASQESRSAAPLNRSQKWQSEEPEPEPEPHLPQQTLPESLPQLRNQELG
ncbi:hypothetical protein BTVI_83828 [Pitangus sulphuratus]|nr:hypothetical protein BTVI_83828 [Pitangus sulphuratus]